MRINVSILQPVKNNLTVYMILQFKILSPSKFQDYETHAGLPVGAKKSSKKVDQNHLSNMCIIFEITLLFFGIKRNNSTTYWFKTAYTRILEHQTNWIPLLWHLSLKVGHKLYMGLLWDCINNRRTVTQEQWCQTAPRLLRFSSYSGWPMVTLLPLYCHSASDYILPPLHIIKWLKLPVYL